MADEDVDFLDARGLVVGDDQAMVGEALGGDAATVAAGEAGSDEAAGTRRLQGLEDVRRIAGGGQSDQHVAGAAEGLDLAGEDAEEPEIIGGGGQRRGVGGQRDRRQSAAVALEADGELRRDVLAVGGAAAIAAEEKLAPGAEHRYSRFGKGGRGREQITGPLRRRQMLGMETVEHRRKLDLTGAHGRALGGIVRKPQKTAMDASVIDKLAQANVLVVGDVLLDRFVEGKVSRVSPEAPVPILKFREARALLGGAGNVAANLLSYGATVTLVGLIGADPAAEEMRELCAGYHRLHGRLIVDTSRPTTVKTRYLSGWHQLLRVDAEDTHAMAHGVAAEVAAAACSALAAARVAVLSDYGKGVLDEATVAAVIKEARRTGSAVLVDPKKKDAGIFAGARLVTPNTEEMTAFTGVRIDSDEAAEAACAKLLDQVAIDAVLVTRGEAGMTLLERTGKPIHVRAETHRVFDVTGAGDTVVATLAAALATGVGLADAVLLANKAAGIAVTKPGTATVQPGELKHALGAHGVAGVAERGEAAEQVVIWREQGLRVGFTNGCFDLLHRGHLYSLEQAARRVDRLVVGVNSDASARRLKGAGRPVQDFATRAGVLAALRTVDLVVPFAEDTPAALIEALAPDVLFKGADYSEADVVGGDFVKARGGRVELLPLLPGHSTTDTLGRMRDGEA